MTDFGRLVVHLTPLIQQTGGRPAASTWLTPTQYSDVTVTHPLNEGRTASVTLSMFDPIVASLQPYQKALLVVYHRPGDDVGEPVFYGQANVEEDYGQATVTLNAQDPSLRMQHHYIRIGDSGMTISHGTKADLTPDPNGILKVLDAAQVAAGPKLGMELRNIDAASRGGHYIRVERGQELWAILQLLVENELGPDIDVCPVFIRGGSDALYAYIDCYQDMGTDRSSSVTFEYGMPQDNATSVQVTPSHPTTYVHVIDNRARWRASGSAGAQVAQTGIFIDWIVSDGEVADEDTEVLTEIARAHLQAYARPLKTTTVTLRSDVGQDYFYGHPEWDGSAVGNFYVGDRVTVGAQRGYRATTSVYRVMAVELSSPGTRGPVETKLTIVPDPAPVDVTVTLTRTEQSSEE